MGRIVEDVGSGLVDRHRAGIGSGDRAAGRRAVNEFGSRIHVSGWSGIDCLSYKPASAACKRSVVAVAVACDDRANGHPARPVPGEAGLHWYRHRMTNRS